MMRRGFAYALLWPTVVAGAIGCSGGGPVPTYSVTGTVKLSDGSPLSGGRVLTRADENSKYPARAEIDAEGAFVLTTFDLEDGAVAGTHKVMITPHIPRESLDAVATKTKKSQSAIDPSYQNLKSTPLTITVTSDGSSDNHFDLVVEPPQKGRKRRR